MRQKCRFYPYVRNIDNNPHKYTCDTSVLHAYREPFCMYLGVLRPHPLFKGFAATLSFLDFLYINFCDFFYFSFFLFCLLPCVSVLPSIYPLFRPTIARMSFCVQLVSRGNLKRLERKYEGYVYCVWI